METQAPNKEAEKSPVAKKKGKMMAIIRIRGLTGVKKQIKDTMDMLCLYKKNFCTIREATPSTMGMIKKIKDYVTYGEISDEVYTLLKTKNPKQAEKKFFRLNAPKKGFGRKGVKVSFSKKGALGYRADKINDLIKRML